MADSAKQELRSPHAPGDYQIVLPCEPSKFRDFVAGLLGKPQTISRHFTGPFEVTRDDITNFFHLVDQRVHQQNDATLTSFTATIIYDDRSSVQLNSLDDLVSYNEIRPLVSQAVHLSWGFLVRFRDKEVPEKQQIDVSIVSEGYIEFDEGVVVRGGFRGGSTISLRIEHTARTWGADIEALLSGHIATLIKTPPKFAQFVRDKSGTIGLALGSLFFLSAVVSTFLATGKFLDHRMQLAAGVKALDPSLQTSLSTKVDFLVDIIASGVCHAISSTPQRSLLRRL